MKKKSKTYLIVQFKKKTLTGLFLFFTCFITTAQITGKAVNELKEVVVFFLLLLLLLPLPLLLLQFQV
jgi:hypothetical protein